MGTLIASLPFIIYLFSPYVDSDISGFIATFLNITSFITTLDNSPQILRNRCSEEINLFVYLASGFNAIAWMCYAILIRDKYIFFYCLIGAIVFGIQTILYLWTLDIIKESNILILVVKFVCLTRNKNQTKKYKGLNPEEEDEDYEEGPLIKDNISES